MLLGGLLLVTVSAGPAAACSCAQGSSEPKRAAGADAIFVGELVGWRVDPSASAREAGSGPWPAPVVFTFEVSRVYKGAVGERQEIVTPGGGGAGCGGFGIGLRGRGPFLVFAHQASNAMYVVGPGRYGSSLCSGSRALADGEPTLGGLSAREPESGSSTAILTVGAGVLAVAVAVGLAVLMARRQARAD
jgi:hypothetical protein